MQAVREGRASRAKKLNKPRTIEEKLSIYHGEIEPALATKRIFEVTEEDLTRLVLAKGKRARVRANRLAGELKVFFGWALREAHFDLIASFHEAKGALQEAPVRGEVIGNYRLGARAGPALYSCHDFSARI
jgi:hypothetical protein